MRVPLLRSHLSVGKHMPFVFLRQLRQFEAMHLPVHVHGHIDEVVRGIAIVGIMSV